MTFLKQNWFKTVLGVICWALFIWGTLVIVAVLGEGDFDALKDWAFYVFGVLPIFAIIFIRHQIKRILLWLWTIMPNKNWFYKNWLKLVGIILVMFVILQYFDYLDRKNALNEERHREEIQQEKREYMAKQKTNCLDIYKTEGSKWNNVRGWRYDEAGDLCYITYKEAAPKTKAQCQASLDSAEAISSPEPVPFSSFEKYLHCIEGTFENSF